MDQQPFIILIIRPQRIWFLETKKSTLFTLELQINGADNESNNGIVSAHVMKI